MAGEKPNPSQKKQISSTRKKLATVGVQVSTGAWVKVVIKKRPFLFSS